MVAEIEVCRKGLGQRAGLGLVVEGPILIEAGVGREDLRAVVDDQGDDGTKEQEAAGGPAG